MKLQYSILGIVLSAVLLLAGCKDDDDDEFAGATGELRLTAEIKGMGVDEAASRFGAGDEVGMWLSAAKVEADLNRAEVAKNLRFMQSAGGLVSDPATAWNRQPSLELYAYAPYDEKAAENPAAYAFSIEPRQDSLALLPEGNRMNDLLYARQTLKYSNEVATVSFGHLMSKVVLHIRSNSSTAGALLDSKVTVKDVQLESSVNFGTGVVTAKGDRKEVKGAKLENVPDGYEVAYEAIIVPQTVTVGTQLLEILTASNYAYIWNVDKDFVFESGKQTVLDVEVKETECVVRIKNIAPWQDNEKITGIAEEDLPTYKVFDYYNRHGIQGIVISVDETGKHGWIVSLDETKAKWCTNPGAEYPNADNHDDAFANLEAARLVDPTLEMYPALKWCDDKNVNGLTGWVLPALNVLKLFGDAVIKDENGHKAFNATIQSLSEIEEKNEIVMDRNNWATEFYYYSSTLNTGSYTQPVRCCGWRGLNVYEEKDCYAVIARPLDSDGSVNQETMTPNLCRVRAFHEF